MRFSISVFVWLVRGTDIGCLWITLEKYCLSSWEPNGTTFELQGTLWGRLEPSSPSWKPPLVFSVYSAEAAHPRVFDMCVWDMPADLHFNKRFGYTGGLLTIL